MIRTSSEVLSVIYALGKDSFVAPTFKGLSDFFSYKVKKLVVYFDLYEFCLPFSRTEDQINTLNGK